MAETEKLSELGEKFFNAQQEAQKLIELGFTEVSVSMTAVQPVQTIIYNTISGTGTKEPEKPRPIYRFVVHGSKEL
jgi:hypothetical protein